MMAFLITVIVLGFFEKVNRNGEDKESQKLILERELR